MSSASVRIFSYSVGTAAKVKQFWEVSPGKRISLLQRVLTSVLCLARN